MGMALAIVGWMAFVAAAAAAVLVRQSLAARSEAVARACHEVRGSLTAARVGLEWGSVQAPHSRLRAIEFELDRAAAALDDLQHVDVRMGHRAADLVDVRTWLVDSIDAFRPLAKPCGIDLCLDRSGPLGQVLGRRARLAQASDNLIANAIEHGGPPIRVRGQVEEGRVRIEVADGGPGLSAEVVRSLDDGGRRRWRGRWHQGNGRRGRGLTIARDVALEHGGRLTALPSADGARLMLELPLAEAAAVRVNGAAPPAVGGKSPSIPWPFQDSGT